MTVRPLATTLDPLDPEVRSAARRPSAAFDDDGSPVGQVIASMLRDGRR